MKIVEARVTGWLRLPDMPPGIGHFSTARRATFAAIGGAVLFIASAALLPEQSDAQRAPAPWRQPDSTAAHSRANLTESILTRRTIAGAARLASISPNVDPARFCDDATPAAPVESGGAIFFLDGGEVIKADAETGAIVWGRVLDPSGTTEYRKLVVVQGVVVAGGADCVSVSDPVGSLAAVSADTGEILWTTPSHWGTPIYDMVTAGGLLITEGSSVGSGFSVEARSVGTGVVKWTRYASFDCAAAGTPVIAVVARHVIFANCEGTDVPKPELVGVELSNGAPEWTRSGNWAVLAGADSPGGADVYARDLATDRIAAVDPESGAVKGRLPRNAAAVLAVGPALVYTTCTNGVCAYSRQTRARLWRTAGAFASPLAALAGGVLYVGDGVALRSDTGAQLRSLWSGDATSLIVGDGHIAAVTSADRLDTYGLHS